MKKSILTLALPVLIFACKKDKTTEFTPTDVTGTSIVRGTVSKNIITPNGSGGWTNNTHITAAGVSINIKVNKNSLYPNSTAQGADVYSATTDNNGNYSVIVRSNATGVDALLSIDGFSGTLDTLINGTVKAGFYSTYSGTSQNLNLFTGQNARFDYRFTGHSVTTNPNTNLKTGTAAISGSLGINFLKEVTTGTFITLTTTNVPVANHKVYLSFDKDPNSLDVKFYETTTDGSGYYTFNISTIENGTPGFSAQNATIWINDYATTRDTIKVNNVKVMGRAGVFHMKTMSQNSLYNGNIRNANHFVYTTFVPD